MKVLFLFLVIQFCYAFRLPIYQKYFRKYIILLLYFLYAFHYFLIINIIVISVYFIVPLYLIVSHKLIVISIIIFFIYAILGLHYQL